LSLHPPFAHIQAHRRYPTYVSNSYRTSRFQLLLVFKGIEAAFSGFLLCQFAASCQPHTLTPSEKSLLRPTIPILIPPARKVCCVPPSPYSYHQREKFAVFSDIKQLLKYRFPNVKRDLMCYLFAFIGHIE